MGLLQEQQALLAPEQSLQPQVTFSTSGITNHTSQKHPDPPNRSAAVPSDDCSRPDLQADVTSKGAELLPNNEEPTLTSKGLEKPTCKFCETACSCVPPSLLTVGVLLENPKTRRNGKRQKTVINRRTSRDSHKYLTLS